MKTSKAIVMSWAVGALFAGQSARADYVGLRAFLEYNDGNGHDIYRVYAEFDDPDDAVVFCSGYGANPLTIQSRRNSDTEFGDHFYNPGGFGGNGPPYPPSPLDTENGTFVTIGLPYYGIGPSYKETWYYNKLSFSPGFPNFINNASNFVNSNMGWFTSGIEPQGIAGANVNGTDNDTALRVMIMQLAVTTGDTVRGTLNIGVVDGLHNGMLITAQTFNSIPAPGALPLLALACLFASRRRRC